MLHRPNSSRSPHPFLSPFCCPLPLPPRRAWRTSCTFSHVWGARCEGFQLLLPRGFGLWQGSGPGQGDSTEERQHQKKKKPKHQSKSTNRKSKKLKEKRKRKRKRGEKNHTKKVKRKGKKKKVRNNPKDVLTALSQDGASLRERGICSPPFLWREVSANKITKRKEKSIKIVKKSPQSSSSAECRVCLDGFSLLREGVCIGVPAWSSGQGRIGREQFPGGFQELLHVYFTRCYF